MRRKGFVFGVAAVFVLSVVFDYVIHQQLLTGLYSETSEVWRDPADMQMFPMLVSQLLFVFMFVYIFTLHYENKGMGEGFRYGSYVGLMLAALQLGSYTYLPITFLLTACWMLAAYLKCMLSGLLLCEVYKL